MVNSPAELVRAALIVKGIGLMPDAGVLTQVWPIFVSHMPSKPDNVICVYDTPGLTQGRIHRTGETIKKPGWQIRVRGLDHPTGYAKISAIQAAVDSVRNLNIAIAGVGYIVQALNQKGGVMSLGQESDADKRNGFTLNGIITLKEI